MDTNWQAKPAKAGEFSQWDMGEDPPQKTYESDGDIPVPSRVHVEITRKRKSTQQEGIGVQEYV